MDENGRRFSPVSLAVAGAVAFVLALILLVGSIVGSYALTLSTVHHESTIQQAQAKANERKLCTTLDHLARLEPPIAHSQSDKSRVYLQQLHNTLAQLKPDIGCK